MEARAVALTEVVRAAAEMVAVVRAEARAAEVMVEAGRAVAMVEVAMGEVEKVVAAKVAVARAVATVVVWAAVTVVVQCCGRRCTAVRSRRSPQPSTCHRHQGRARRTRRCLRWADHPPSWRSCTGHCSSEGSCHHLRPTATRHFRSVPQAKRGRSHEARLGCELLRRSAPASESLTACRHEWSCRSRRQAATS